MNKLLWTLIIILTGVYIATPIIDPDLWWHITAGRWILANHEVPVVDYWNAFAAGKPWMAYSWSNEIIFALTDKFFGISGLLVLQIILAVFLSFSFSYVLSRQAGDWFFGALLGCFSTLACFNHFTLRPQAIVWALFIFLLYFLDQIHEHGLNKRTGFAVFLIMFLWANTHITTIFGICLIIALLYEKGSTQNTLKTLLIALLATLFTPYLGAEWFLVFLKSDHPLSYQLISEFKPATVLQYSTAFLIIAISILIVFYHKQPKNISPIRLAILCLFVLAGFAVTKFLPFAVLICCFYVAGIWKNEPANKINLGNLAQAFSKLEVSVSKIPKQGLCFLIIALIIVKTTQLWREPVGHAHVPKLEVDFIEKYKLPGPILNGFGHGGYLMYRFSDANGNLADYQRVSIDGRTNVNPHEIWNMYQASLLGKEDWQKYIELVKPNTILWKTESPLVSLLLAQSDWCRVLKLGQADVGSSIFVKKSLIPKLILAENEIKTIISECQ